MGNQKKTKSQMQKTTCFAVALQMASAIIYRDDFAVSNYQSMYPRSNYPNVFPYDNTGEGEWNCAATLISKRHAVTAAHCFDSEQDDFEVDIDGKTHTVTDVIRNPCYNSIGEEPIAADLAILVLDSDATPTPATIFEATIDGEEEVGKEILIMGWGLYGPVSNGEPDDYGSFHAGVNIVTDVWNEMIRYEMD